jgi:hypothetical protein
MTGETKPTFSASRRWLSALNVLIASVSFLALLVMVNYLSAGHFLRFQWTSNPRIQLAPQTLKILDAVTNEVAVTIFFDARGEDVFYSLVTGLLREYSFRNPRIKVTTIDRTRFHGQAEAFLAQNKLSSLTERDFIMFESEGRKKVHFKSELSDLDLSGILSGETQEVRRTGFKGEQLFSAAIFSVTYPRQQRAYFLQGHGEHSPDNTSEPGYAKFASILKDQNNVQWEKLLLAGEGEIPPDCHLLIIPGGGRVQFPDHELAKIDAYLREGGRLLLLLPNMLTGAGTAGLEKLLTNWGVGTANYLIDDKALSVPGDGLMPQLNEQHAIMKPLAAENLPLHLVRPRWVAPTIPSATPAANPTQVYVLGHTSTNALGALLVPKESGGFEIRDRRKGSFSLMVAVEQGAIKNVSTERGLTRMVVIGDSLCFDNELIGSGANSDFAGFVVNWLLDRPQFMIEGLGPRPIKEYKVAVTQGQMRTLQLLLLAGMPGAVLLLGALVWLRRRS